jgi:ABC-type dipeptide/oligopeptide/nickel transport system permease component
MKSNTSRAILPAITLAIAVSVLTGYVYQSRMQDSSFVGFMYLFFGMPCFLLNFALLFFVMKKIMQLTDESSIRNQAGKLKLRLAFWYSVGLIGCVLLFLLFLQL